MTESNHQNPQPGQPVSQSRFKPQTPHLQNTKSESLSSEQLDWYEGYYVQWSRHASKETAITYLQKPTLHLPPAEENHKKPLEMENLITEKTHKNEYLNLNLRSWPLLCISQNHYSNIIHRLENKLKDTSLYYIMEYSFQSHLHKTCNPILQHTECFFTLHLCIF
jgi:hypothetical protein